MITQETTVIGGELFRVYTFVNPDGGSRVATVNTRGHVRGYSSSIAYLENVADYVNIDSHSTNDANRIAIYYVNGGR